jgi:S1-C subfamily serine protease
MSAARALLAAAVLAAGCASLTPARRDDVIRHIVPSAVQLRVERDGGGRASASGVVLASDPGSQRTWILTTRHTLGTKPRQVHVTGAGHRRLSARIAAVSEDADLAVLEVTGLVLPPVAFQEAVRLGDEVWVVAFPWGRRLTVVSGVVSQVASEDDQPALEGPVLMIDASVSYGASGGGVFEAGSGRLIGIVEGYRTARVAPPGRGEPVLDLPVPGETVIVPTPTILRFLSASGLASLARRE